MTANTFVQGHRVKGQGHSVCKRQRRLTAKYVRISCLFTVTRGVAPRDLHLWLPDGTSQNAIFSNKKKQKMVITCQIDWREVGVAFELQCPRYCMLSSYYYCVIIIIIIIINMLSIVTALYM